ncbi:hypothetical protein CRG98_015056 [Punica granatum]|uniref:Uncharacterized protein n=1 Tax=Punica granatum TaxID=22663 RepID=A0A2I0K7V9_PUNGR|nr:hypothetical protein CRG98_015056 [Punica granatum]
MGRERKETGESERETDREEQATEGVGYFDRGEGADDPNQRMMKGVVAPLVEIGRIPSLRVLSIPKVETSIPATTLRLGSPAHSPLPIVVIDALFGLNSV